MPDFDDDLRALAGHAQRTGRLGPAAEIRGRADRRRKRRYAATAALGVALVAALGAGIAVAQPSPAPPPPASPPSVFSGRRQVSFQVLDVGQEVPGAALSVDAKGRLQVVTGADDSALFVPTPAAAGKFRIRTSAAQCLAVKSNDSQPLTVVTATCDPADAHQLFAFDSNGEDEQGRANYGIDNDGAYLQWDPTGKSGLIATETGGYLSDTTFVLTDRGPSTLPK
jgi:hypothetical protein